MSQNSLRPVLVALLSGVALAAAGCPPTAAAPCVRDPQVTFVFLDRSASSQVGPQTARVFNDTLNGLVAGSLQCPGDAVHAFLVHGATRGKAYRADAVHQIELPKTEGVQSGIAAQAKADYEASLERLHSETRAKLFALRDSTVVGRNLAAHTDMLGTLQVVADELKGGPNASQARIYYLSDMNESMSGAGRRDFDRRPPGTVQEAESWAQADAAGVARTIPLAATSRVRVIQGELANRPGAPNVNAYWAHVLRHAGFTADSIRFN